MANACMRVMKISLWTLNRVATWDLKALAKALAVEGWFGSSRHSVRLGNRHLNDRDGHSGKPSKEGVLSHEEGDGYNEYFVPIAVKCIGDPNAFLAEFDGDMTDAGRALLQRIRLGQPEHFEPEHHPRFRAYWETGDGTAMYTRPGVGFYQLVARDLRPDEQAVLVGYSQGGLVARFLAFLDEYLMRPAARRIAGVITVQAPNAGSPLANSRNADQVALGLFGVLSGVAGFPIPPCGAHSKLGEAALQLTCGTLMAPDGPRHFDISALCGLLDAAIVDAKGRLDSADKVELLSTMRKWLSGVEPVPSYITAFADLNTANLDVRDSVLQLVAANPLQATFHGAIVGTDNRLTDFISAGLPWYMRPVFDTWIRKLESPVHQAEQAYSRIALDERGTLKALDAANALASASTYFEGRPSAGGGIAPQAHDFIIPSISQEMPMGAPEFFLGNAINPRGTHLSGGNERDKNSDKPFVSRMLTEMGERLVDLPRLRGVPLASGEGLRHAGAAVAVPA